MPYCEECAKYRAPSSMAPDGTCPTCGRRLEGPTASLRGKDIRELAGDDARAPWHFKLLMVAAIGYLGWRVLVMVGIVG